MWHFYFWSSYVNCWDTHVIVFLRIFPSFNPLFDKLIGSAPEYMVNQLQDYCPTRALQSGDQNLLSVKKTRIKIGD